MKQWKWLTAAAVVALVVVTSRANAVPAYARQTGFACNQCHMSWSPTPDFTVTGQKFRMNAYRDGGGLPGLAALYERAARLEVPILVHTGTSVFPGARNKYGDPMDLDDVAVDFPDLTLVMAHGGRPLYMDTCLFLLRRHRNVQMDISGIPPKTLLRYFPRLEDVARKTMFGTDWPGPGVPGVRVNVEAFRALPLSDEAREAILSGTADRVYPRR